MIQILSPPPASLVKRIFLPSGLKRGCTSKGKPLRKDLALPPLIGSMYISPSKSNTISLPSGLTSKFIQVPSSVWRETSLKFQLPSGSLTFHLSAFCAKLKTLLNKNISKTTYLRFFMIFKF